MNKWQIICPLVAMAIAALVFLRIASRGQHRAYIVAASDNIGRDLIVSTNSPHLVRVGPDLTARLGELLSATTHVAAVSLGDAPAPFGDGRACSRVVLTNEQGRGISIRLCRANVRGKFNVLGYQTVPP